MCILEDVDRELLKGIHMVSNSKALEWDPLITQKALKFIESLEYRNFKKVACGKII